MKCEEQSFQILDFVFVITNHITKLTCSTGLLLILLVNNSWHLVNYHLFSRNISILSFRKIKLFLKAFTSFLPEVLATQKERATPYLLAKKHRLQPGFVDVSHTETRKYKQKSSYQEFLVKSGIVSLYIYRYIVIDIFKCWPCCCQWWCLQTTFIIVSLYMYSIIKWKCTAFIHFVRLICFNCEDILQLQKQ